MQNTKMQKRTIGINGTCMSVPIYKCRFTSMTVFAFGIYLCLKIKLDYMQLLFISSILMTVDTVYFKISNAIITLGAQLTFCNVLVIQKEKRKKEKEEKENALVVILLYQVFPGRNEIETIQRK